MDCPFVMPRKFKYIKKELYHAVKLFHDDGYTSYITSSQNDFDPNLRFRVQPGYLGLFSWRDFKKGFGLAHLFFDRNFIQNCDLKHFDP